MKTGNSYLLWFSIIEPSDWLKKTSQHSALFYPIRGKTKTNRGSLEQIFPRFASVTCILEI